MHNRQSGAAHVPIMFFLLLLVMFLGALGFAYVVQTKNGELIKSRDTAKTEAAQLKEQALLTTDYIADVFDAVQKPGKYEGRQGGQYGQAAMTMPGVMDPAELKKTMEKACADAGVSTASGLENVLGSLLTTLNQSKRRVTEIEAERDKALADKNEADKKFRELKTEVDSKVAEWARNLDQARSDFETAKADKDNRITQVQDNLKAKAEELANMKDQFAAEAKVLAKKVADAQMQASAMTARVALLNPPDEADGKILLAKTGIATGFINLGQKDLVVAGTVFRVRNPNSKEVKGYATVTRVEPERSEVALSDFKDPIGDYAREGDLLYNDFFAPRMTRTIYLMGAFSAPYHKPELTKLLTRLGNKVVDKMVPGVDLVIIGNNPVNEVGDGFAPIEETEEFKKATELRVEFTYLPKVRDLIKL